MTSEKKFYVYVHRKATDGSVFYVGKGKGDRAWRKSSRSTYWKNIVNKYGYTFSILAEFINEECAFSFERALIKFYGRKNLCNLTDGGDGTSGYVMSDETKEKIGAKSIGRKFSEKERKRRSVFQSGKVRTDDTKEKMSKALIGKKRLKTTGSKNPKFRHELFTFVSNEKLFKGTVFDFCNTYEVDKSCVCKIVNGFQKKHRGWSLIDPAA